jgi:hypothetical protein
MVAVPSATPWTTPALSTVAMDVALLCHEVASDPQCALVTFAVSVVVEPAATVAGVGEIVTAETVHAGGLTEPSLPPHATAAMMIQARPANQRARPVCSDMTMRGG